VELVAVALAASRIHRQPLHFVEIEPSDLGEIDVTTANELCALAQRLSKAGQPIPTESWLLR
jgi:hypothetical protein